jgi:hypothetical protein
MTVIPSMTDQLLRELWYVILGYGGPVDRLCFGNTGREAMEIAAHVERGVILAELAHSRARGVFSVVDESHARHVPLGRLYYVLREKDCEHELNSHGLPVARASFGLQWARNFFAVVTLPLLEYFSGHRIENAWQVRVPGASWGELHQVVITTNHPTSRTPTGVSFLPKIQPCPHIAVECLRARTSLPDDDIVALINALEERGLVMDALTRIMVDRPALQCGRVPSRGFVHDALYFNSVACIKWLGPQWSFTEKEQADALLMSDEMALAVLGPPTGQLPVTDAMRRLVVIASGVAADRVARYIGVDALAREKRAFIDRWTVTSYV